MHRFHELDPSAYLPPEELLARLQTPALVVRLDLVRANVRRMLARTAGGERWRPHVKTTKCPAIWAELAAAGVRRFKCATTREARVLCATLVEAGVSGADVCLAYPLDGPGLDALGALARETPEVRLSVLCEDAEVAARVPPELGVLVDVNVGMDRTGVPVGDLDAILAVARAAERSAVPRATARDERFAGLHAYEGHLVQADRAERRRAAFACHARLCAVVAALREAGLAVPELVTSGTPGCLDALAFPGYADLGDTRHRVSPGTVVLHDARSEEETPELGLAPAAAVLARVVSRPAPGVATCDAGSKALAAEAGDPCAVVLGRPDLAARVPSEEHLPLSVLSGGGPARGELLALAPRHVCPTVNLAGEAVLCDGPRASVVAIAARGHEVLR